MPKCAKKAFPLIIFFSRTKRDVEKMNTEVIYFDCEQLLLAAYTLNLL
jgi:hypothetical protein